MARKRRVTQQNGLKDDVYEAGFGCDCLNSDISNRYSQTHIIHMMFW